MFELVDRQTHVVNMCSVLAETSLVAFFEQLVKYALDGRALLRVGLVEA